MGAGTPTFTPTMPAETRERNSRAALPEEVKMHAPLPKDCRFAASMAALKVLARITLSTGPKISWVAMSLP